jgi:broad-specificity NMP kinase
MDKIETAKKIIKEHYKEHSKNSKIIFILDEKYDENTVSRLYETEYSSESCEENFKFKFRANFEPEEIIVRKIIILDANYGKEYV